MERPYASIIIPNYNNSNSLEKCLQGATNQSYPTHLYEIIVIDNGSNDNLLKIKSCFPQVIFHSTNNPKSPYACRNKGISLSKGTILAFTDSNSYPDYDWLSQGVEFLIKHNSLIAAGQIHFLHSNPIKIAEALEILTFPSPNQIISSGKSGTTKNLFVQRTLIEKIGSFLIVRSNGDSEFIRRSYAVGHPIKYNSRAIIFYPVPSTLYHLVRKQFRIGRGNMEVASSRSLYRRLACFIRTFAQMRPPGVMYVRNFVTEKGYPYEIEINSKIYFGLWLIRISKGAGRIFGFFKKSI